MWWALGGGATNIPSPCPFTWASHIATSGLAGCWTLPSRPNSCKPTDICIFQPKFEHLYEANSHIILPLGMCIKSYFHRLNLSIRSVSQVSSAEFAIWNYEHPLIIMDLAWCIILSALACTCTKHRQMFMFQRKEIVRLQYNPQGVS